MFSPRVDVLGTIRDMFFSERNGCRVCVTFSWCCALRSAPRYQVRIADLPSETKHS